jgi:hypothetical protein
VLKKDNDVIITEIKYGKEETASKLTEKALSQIRDRKYYEKYIDSFNVSLLAIAFGDKKEIACGFDRC